MYLLDYAEVDKNGKKFRIATFFDPSSRRKVVTKFLRPEVNVPIAKLIILSEIRALDKNLVAVTTDLQGDVKEIK